MGPEDLYVREVLQEGFALLKDVKHFKLMYGPPQVWRVIRNATSDCLQVLNVKVQKFKDLCEQSCQIVYLLSGFARGVTQLIFAFRALRVGFVWFAKLHYPFSDAIDKVSMGTVSNFVHDYIF